MNIATTSTDNYQSLLNLSIYDLNVADIIISGLDTNKLLYLNASSQFATSSTGSGLLFTGGVLSLDPTASPTFAGLTLTGMNGVLKAVAGVIGGGATTSDLGEGTNLYYTDGRARAALSQGTGISYNSSTGVISNSGVTSITGTANQVIASASTGAVTLSLPQSIDTAATCQLGQLSLGSVAGTAGQLYVTAATGKNGIIAVSPNVWGAVLQNSGASTSVSLAGANFAALFAGGNVGIGTTNPYGLLHLESAQYGTALTAASYRLVTQGSATFKYMSGIGQLSADDMWLNSKTSIDLKLQNTSLLTITSGTTTIANNAVVTGTTTCNAGLYSYGIDSYSYVAVPMTSGFVGFNGGSAGSYSIQALSASSTYPMRFAGSSSTTPQRSFDFGNYTSDNAGLAWNSRFKINSYSGNLTTVGSATFGGDINTTGSCYISGTFAANGASNTAAAYTCYGSPSGDASSLNNYCLLMRNTGTPSTCTGIGMGYGNAGSEILWGNAYTAHQWYIQNSSKMYLNSSGLGIGIDTPAEKLETKGAIVAYSTSGKSGDFGNYYAKLQANYSSTALQLTGYAGNEYFGVRDWTNTVMGLSGNVGIGTTTPQNLLSLANNKYLAWRNYANNSETVGIISSTSDDLRFYVNGTRMAIDSSGNASIGWGTGTIAGVKLAIHDAANTYANPQVRVASANDFVKCGLGFDGLWNTDALYFYTAGSSTAKILIDYYGKVGIGGAPAAPLHVNSTVSYADMSTNPMGGQLILSSTNGGRTYIGEYFTGGVGQATAIQNSDYYSGSDHYGSIILNPRGGWVGIGTVPSSQLHVKGGSSALTDYSLFTAENGNGQGLTFGYDSTAGRSWIYGRSVGVAAHGINMNNVFYTGTYSQGIGVQALPTAACITCVSGNVYGAPSSYANYRLLCYDTGSAAGSYGIGIEGSTQWYNSGAYHKWYAGGTQTMLLDNGGNLSTVGNLQVRSTGVIKGIQAGTVAAQGSPGTVTVTFPVAFAGGSTVVVNMTVIYGGIGYQVVALLASTPTTTGFTYNILNGGSSHFEHYAGIHWVAYAI